MTRRARLAALGGCVLALLGGGLALDRAGWWSAPPRESSRGIAGVRASLPASRDAQPALWLLSIGVSRYEDERIGLEFADDDALALGAAFEAQERAGLYAEAKTLVLTNEKVTRESILQSAETFLGQAGPDDVAVIFLAGHGLQERATGSYYFLPHPATPENLLTEGLRMSDFDEAVRLLRRNVSRVVVMLDTCHAGAMRFASRAAASGADLAAQISVAEGLYLLAAAKPGEESTENRELGHGAFTYALLEGLKGAADPDADGMISVADVFGYVARRVPRLTEGRQHPYHKIEGTDLILAAVRKTGDAPATAGNERAIERALAPPAATPMANAIGVMEFRNLRPNKEHDWMGRALQTALNTELSKVRALRVYASEMIDSHKSRGLDDLEAARRLGVTTVVTGEFVVVGGRIRIDGRIVDASSGMHESSDSMEGDVEDFFEVEKKLVLSMLRRMPVAVSVAENESIKEETNNNVNAYRLLLEAEGVAEDSAPAPPPPSGKTPEASPALGESSSDDRRSLRTGDPGRGGEGSISVSSRRAGAISTPLRHGLSHLASAITMTSLAEAAEPAGVDKTTVLRFLEEYRKWYERKDLDQLARLYESLSSRQRTALETYLGNADRLSVELTDVEVEGLAPSAPDARPTIAVTYTRRDTFVDKQTGQPTNVEVRLTKFLVRNGDDWKLTK